VEEARQVIALADCVNCLVRVAPDLGVYGTASNKLFDALAAGRTVLCCRASPEIAQITEEYRCGIILEADFDAARVKKALLLLRDNPEHMVQFARNAHRACVEKYHRGQAVENLYQAYRASARGFPSSEPEAVPSVKAAVR
jgi:glycosyltransferase involved in cell wall biosynthesis